MIKLKILFSANPLLFTAVIAGVVICLVHLCFSINIPDDVAAYYGSMVEAFGNGQWREAFLENVPPLMPALAGIVHSTGVDTFSALIIVSSGFYLLTLFPLYKFLRLFVSERVSGLGCLLYIIAPKIIEMGCSGLLNSGRNFFFMMVAWLLLSYARKAAPVKLLLFAVCLAGLTLVRGEGIIYLPLFLLWFVCLSQRREILKKNAPVKAFAHVLLRLVCVITIVLAVLSPRIYQIYQCTGIPAVDIRQADMIAGILDNTPRCVDLSNDAESNDSGIELTGDQPFRLNWRQLRSEVSFINGEIYLWLAVIGVILLWRRRMLNLEHIVLLSFMIWNILIFLIVAFNLRYFTLNILLLMPLTVYGLMWLYQICAERRLRSLFTAVAVLLAVWQIYSGTAAALDRRHVDELQLNHWLQANTLKLIEAAGKTDTGRKLVIFSNRPQFSFRANADWVKPVWRKNHWALPPVEVLQAQNVDIAIVRQSAQFYKTVAASKHFKLLPHPFSDMTGIFIFRPLITDADNMPKDEPENNNEQ
jgi:4-amino-4-deoxy-L-arabinose transferase-like glycosyltransferase